MNLIRLLCLTSVFCLLPLFVHAHPGGLDKNCGHNNRKTGDYHYHPTWKSCKSNPSNVETGKRPRTPFSVDGEVIRVKDGDTVVVRPELGGEAFTCRLYGIDTPETSKRGKMGQPYGGSATKELKTLILGKLVKAHLTGEQSYKREICIIYDEGVNINLEMVKRGYAWAYRQYLEGPHASEYIDAEREARKQRLGLWKDNNPMPPWEFRKR
jgi:endonuclease YncB( thermonuclease family)